jgi:hypothetical protein
MALSLGVPIEVLARFSPHARYPRPLTLSWNGRERQIDAIHLVHEAHEGTARLVIFSVTAEGDVLELCYNSERAHWTADDGHRWSEG